MSSGGNRNTPAKAPTRAPAPAVSTSTGPARTSASTSTPARPSASTNTQRASASTSSPARTSAPTSTPARTSAPAPSANTPQSGPPRTVNTSGPDPDAAEEAKKDLAMIDHWLKELPNAGKEYSYLVAFDPATAAAKPLIEKALSTTLKLGNATRIPAMWEPDTDNDTLGTVQVGAIDGGDMETLEGMGYKFKRILIEVGPKERVAHMPEPPAATKKPAAAAPQKQAATNNAPTAAASAPVKAAPTKSNTTTSTATKPTVAKATATTTATTTTTATSGGGAAKRTTATTGNATRTNASTGNGNGTKTGETRR